MRVLRRVLAVAAAVLVLAATAFVVSAFNDRSAAGDRRVRAQAEAGADAHRYAAGLVPAFTAGPQTAMSLEALAARTAVHVVTLGRDGGSVVVGVMADVVYPTGWGASEVGSSCLRVVLARTGESITEQASDIPCSELPPGGSLTEAFAVR
ncbi:hypothetical protein [Kitasatospora sp. NPDC056731]|uniref:hypothetical protein n=1 Tax=Kitasatospora sp. NPDC056731 TaxID=3155422 RepID=UPI0034319943